MIGVKTQHGVTQQYSKLPTALAKTIFPSGILIYVTNGARVKSYSPSVAKNKHDEMIAFISSVSQPKVVKPMAARRTFLTQSGVTGSV